MDEAFKVTEIAIMAIEKADLVHHKW